MHLFTYGTLMFPAVFRAVTGTVLPGEDAELKGYARYRVAGTPYPGIVPEGGAATRGVLYRDPGERLLLLLDRFEGDDYARTAVQVVVRGGPVAACAYVIRPAARHRLAAEPWDPARFPAEGQAAFLDEYEGFERIGPPP